MILPLWLACSPQEPVPSPTSPSPSSEDTGWDTAEEEDTAAEVPPPVDRCGEVSLFEPVFADVVARWVAQDVAAPWPAGGLVFVGSSSIRRWEDLARAYSAYGPIQRGFGGSQAGEVALFAEDLVVRHAPRAVVVFAGTNDVAAGVSAEVVVERLRCLRQRLPAEVPLLILGITPTPARWDLWPTAAAVNAALQALPAAEGIVYVDVPSAFLATGAPPDAALFVGDQLHLSEAGYALWDAVLRPAVEAALPDPLDLPTAAGFPPGARILIDLGPSDGDDGEISPSPDYLGQHWNNWHAVDGGAEILPGEHLDDLVTDDGSATGIALVISGGFFANGRQSGGLLWPQAERLGGLAVGSATGDFFTALPEDSTGGLYLRGLDPERTYTLHFFAAREEGSVRVTRYTVHGSQTDSTTLQTSGAGAGAEGALTNDDTIAAVRGMQPDAHGHLFVDVSIESGEYAYLSVLELIAE